MASTLNLLKPTTHYHIHTLFHSSNSPSLLSSSLKTQTKSPLFSIKPPTLPNHYSRRLFLTSVSGICDAFTGGPNNPREAALAIRRGMLLFRQGDVSGSLAEFDKAIELDPRQKACKRTAISDSAAATQGNRNLGFDCLSFKEKLEKSIWFEEGAEQFRIDVAQNPNDTEESIWCFLCEAQLYGVDVARQKFLEASCVGRDSRPFMREPYYMFKDGGDPEKLVAAFSNGAGNEYFYASLYAGLYHESQFRTLQKTPDAAKIHIVAACQSPYGQRSDDYMASLAKVHCLYDSSDSVADIDVPAITVNTDTFRDLTADDLDHIDLKERLKILLRRCLFALIH
ncbi:hypothetical protein ACFE04_005132 [Oxalis oulophora]